MPAIMLATPASGRGMSRDVISPNSHHHHPPPPHHQHHMTGGPPPPQHFQGGYPTLQMGHGGGQHPQDPRMNNYEQHQDFLNYEDQEELRRLQILQDLETLRHIITQWNANRLDLFELSMPNENLEFHGVMRFYYQAQDLASGQKVATKCIRVSSQATTKAIIETLIEKFRPDMKMLEMPEYALYEIHESGERRLGLDEKPLLVQLNWHKDDREGRFLLRRIDEASQMPATTQEDSSFKRKLSKREKKDLKKAEKKAAANSGKNDKDGDGMAEKLYSELPDTSFTRSISNPEAVMRRRRQQKLEKKLQQFRSKDGGPDTGGTLKIYGDALCKDVPYKTLLLSINDTAAGVVGEMLDKYGLNKAEAGAFCLVQATTLTSHAEHMDLPGGRPGSREYVLEDDECPLAILMNHQAQANRGGAITFHVRRRMPLPPPDGGRYGDPRFSTTGGKKKSAMMVGGGGSLGNSAASHLPFLVELTQSINTGSNTGQATAGPDSRIIRLKMTVTEIGSGDGSGSGIALAGLQRRHCVVAHTDGGIITVTPCSPAAEVLVNGQRIEQTTILKNRSVVQFGGSASAWQLIDPLAMESQIGEDMNHLQNQTAFNSREGFQPQQQPQGKDSILPAVLEFREDTESAFFNALTANLDPGVVNFKLAPTYTLYMATRFRASTHYRPELVPEERAVKLTDMLNRVADKILRLLATPPGSNHAPTLSFWMGNSSELLHFLKSDRHITAFSLQAQDMLADAVHMAFKQLVLVLQSELETVLPSLLSDRDDDVEMTTMGILNLFTNTMALLRKCRVNAALTIQLFSQLFHFVNMWTFNLVVSEKNKGAYCTHKWGLRLKRRLSRIEIWAEKQGLELAADCHLARIMQTAHLLQARKSTAEDIATLSSTCFKLNSIQLRYLLSHYHAADAAEAPISTELIDTIVRVAENTVDELTRSEGRQVRLEEDFVLQLPFLLPEDNYSCDIIRGVPAGLTEFLSPLQNAGLCVMTPQPSSSGHWTIYMDNHNQPPLNVIPRSPSELSVVDQGGQHHHPSQPPGQGGFNNNNNLIQGSTRSLHSNQGGHQGGHRQGAGYSPEFNNPPGGSRPMLPPPPPLGGSIDRLSPPSEQLQQPEIMTIRLAKTNGMGLSIVAAKGMGQDRLGIYIKAVVEGGAAWQDGHLAAGDQLLAVDGHSLIGITQEHAAEIMMRTGNYVTLEVARQGAIYHGLATLLSQPSPVISNRGGVTNPAPPPPLTGQRIPQSKSTPALHHSSDYQNQEWLHQQFTGSMSRHHSVAMDNGRLPPGGQPPMPIRSSVSGDRVNQITPPDTARDNFYQNLGPHSGGGGQHPGRNRIGGSQTSLTGNSYAAAPGSNSSAAAARIARPASTHFMNAASTSSIMLTEQQQQQQMMMMMSRSQSTASYVQQSPGPEKPSRQYSYEIHESDDNNTAANTNTIEKPRTVRFMEADSSPVQEEREEESDHDDPQLYESETTPPPPPTEAVSGPGTARLDMLLNSNSSSHQPVTSSNITSPPKRVSFQSSEQQSLVVATSVTNTTNNESKSVQYRESTKTSSSRVSFRDPYLNQPSFTSREEEEIDNFEGGEDNLERREDLDDTEQEENVDEENINELVEDSRVHRMSRDQDPNTFIREAESLLNDATNGVRDLGLHQAPSGVSGGVGAGSGEGFATSIGVTVSTHTPSVIGTQEVYRDPRQRRLTQQQQERKKSTSHAPDGAKLSFQEKMKLFAQEAGDQTPREKAKISRAQRDIEDT